MADLRHMPLEQLEEFGGETACAFFPCDGNRCEETNRLLRALSGRNRSLACLYAVGETLRARNPSGETLHQVARGLKRVFAAAEAVSVRIELDGVSHETEGCRETALGVTKPLEVSGRRRGVVRVFRDLQSPPFSPEDEELIGAVARQISDTLERYEAEAQLVQASKLASIGELAAGVSHEINNPVNAIINCADLIAQKPDMEPDAAAYVAMIRSEAERIAGIARNLLRFARRDIDRYARVPVPDLLDDVLALVQKRIAKARVRLETSVPEGLPALVCHKEELMQVLINLVLNSVDALDTRYPDGHADKVLHIQAEQRAIAETAAVRIIVEDGGTGIRPEHLERIFDPFFTTKGRDKGTGLGLSVAAGIVRAHGGTLSVESEWGRFTRFCLDLPCDGCAEPFRTPASTTREAT